MRDGVRLSRRHAGLLVVDVQERLFPAMAPELRGRLPRNVGILGATARRLGLPAWLTEQYPKGLGHTLPEVRDALGPVEAIAKVAFSCCAVEGFVARLRAAGVRTLVVAGMEAHVCVLATALDLLAEGFTVHVPVDATASRAREHWATALDLLRAEGAVVTTTETVVFQLLGQADTDEFRALAPLLK